MERDEGIYMSKQGQFFYSTVSDFLNSKLSRKQAADVLEVSERSVTRMARRVEERGRDFDRAFDFVRDPVFCWIR